MFLKRREAIEIAVLFIGGALVICALAANQRWLDRHFLPSFFLPRGWWVLVETGVRVLLAMIGVWLAVFVRTRFGRLVAESRIRVLLVAIAALLALGASELVLRTVRLRPIGWLVPDDEPRRRSDQRLGWILMPSRTGHDTTAG